MISDKGIAMIIRFEGMKLEAYPDPGTGGAPWTIGVGHTGGVKEGDTCTEDQAIDWLREDCQDAESCLDDHCDVELTQNQRDALISFIFNLGCGNFKSSTLLKLLNAGNYDAAAQQFMRWTHAAGRELAGLKTRRELEAKFFLSKTTEVT